ncbi:OmpA family protein [Thalassospiraceae bacterium LMO-JJ14]|nr:OmpA family protein [Thalassospiraceae bacterium LMO-JJ14]
MKFFKFAIAIALLPLLAACAAGPDIASTKAMSNKGTPFHMALQNEYIALAQAEADEYDIEDAVYFNNKAIAAAKGEDVQPQAIKERKITGNAQWELEAARQALRGELLSGAKDWAPLEAAKAQAMFDCWLQEQEEGDQPKDIDACKSVFDASLAKLEKMRPRPMAKPAMKKMMALPGPYTVYFDFDSFDLSATGEAVIKEAAKAGMDAGATGVVVTGHTDKAGSDDYNQGLSRARAASVGNALMSEGIARSMVKREYSGEASPEVATKDGQKEARNRRVTITFTR